MISGAKLAAVTVRATEDVAAAGAAVVGAGAAVPAAREDRGEAEVLPERPQADVPQGPLRRHHLRRHPARPRRLQHVPRRTCPAHPIPRASQPPRLSIVSDVAPALIDDVL